MLKLIYKYLICNGFEPEQIKPLKNRQVEVSVDALKKLSMGIAMLYIAAMIIQHNSFYFGIDLIYLACYSVFLLLTEIFRRKKKYAVAEFAVVFLIISTLSVSIYESTVLCVESRGIFFPLFLILYAVMFTCNPIVMDVIGLIMTVIYLVASYNVKSPVYFGQDVFTACFVYLLSNMMNAMIGRSRINNIIKTDQLKAEQEKYETLYETVPSGIIEYVMSPIGERLININRRGMDIMGLSGDKLPEYLYLEESAHPEDRAGIEKLFYALKAPGDTGSYEYRLKRADGTYIWVVGQCRAVAMEHDGLRIISSCVDVSAEKQAMDANDAKSRFLSRMSHDIRTPMNAVIGLTDIVLDSPELPPSIEENMNSIKTSSTFLLGLINDILDVSKIEAGEMQLSPEPYDKREFIAYLNTMIRPLCIKKGIDFIIDASAALFDYVMLDKVRFNQIFFNLLSNAVKFTPAGGKIFIGIEHLGDEDNIAKMRFRVSDNGIGMSKAFQAHMFDPFSQEDTEHINESQGSGIGLAIVKRIVGLMNGSISVKSAPGEGTEYTIILFAELCEGSKATESVKPDLAGLKAKRVLLCEDHPVNSQIAVSLLSKVGMVADTAANGDEGVKKFLNSPEGSYDAVLMDIRMPVMGGLEAARRIRSSTHADREIPIIAMTANAFDTDREKSLSAGMNDHLLKPIIPDLLYATLLKYIK